ncbi:MAG: DUF5906 domain-containing protein [Clostridiales bacterium]|jgi:putative DNA primase/helicase|nr:DUF5906 domain-containing protein [Clostridiales bacterium]
MYEHIPDELKNLKQWVCWKAVSDETRPGKIKKVPINAMTGGQAQSNNPETWTDFDTAASAAVNYSGIGFMFGGGYFGIDIDNAEGAIEDYKNGETTNIIAEFIHALQSYSEYSVSGKGLHIICRGSLPPRGRRKNNVEMYESGRFFIMTGNKAADYAEISECTASVKALHEKYIGGGAEPTMGFVKPSEVSLDEQEIIELAMKSKQGTFFSDLYRGDWSIYFPSQSEADLSFCNILAFWTGRDAAKMDAIYRKSGMMREKWDRKQAGTTYGAITINKAIADCSNVYEPRAGYSVYINAAESSATPPSADKLYSFDDTGNAQRFIDMFGESVRHSYKNKCWFYYDGRRWCADDMGVVKRMADEAVEKIKTEREHFLESQPMDADLGDAAKAFDKHLKSCRSHKSKTAMLAQAEHHKPIAPDWFDRYIQMLNTPNGTVDLTTGKIAEHDRSQYITKITNVEYTDNTDAPMWQSFLNDIFSGDKEMIRFMQKAIGYSITGSTKEDCIFFCYGTGRNGKSTFLNVLSEILGEYAINVQPETIMAKPNASGHTSDIARLKGARFVTVPEPSEGARLNEGLVKQMTGGDSLTASRKYENEFEFKPEFKLWMPTNYKPKIYGTDVGIWARIRLIPFTVRISDDKMDKNLRQKLKKEAPGILKWAVDGCLLWQREGLKPPAGVADATAEYKTEMDVLAAFLDECCETGDYDTQASDLFKAYLQWAKDNNEYEMTSTKFGREITKRFEKRTISGCNHYRGLRVRDSSIPYQVNILPLVEGSAS